MNFKTIRFSGKNKYNAKKTKTGGELYHSNFEADYAQELEWRRKAGEIKEIKRQHKIELRVNGIHICNYYIDFLVTLSDGRRQYIEVKGFSTDVFRMKWNLCMALKDEIDKDAEWLMIK